MTVKQSKRILSITIKRMDDEFPDTSWLGEYSNTCTSEFSIDRRHALDCQSVRPGNDAVVERLERVSFYLTKSWADSRNDSVDAAYDAAYDDAVCIISDAIDSVEECDCNESGDMMRGEYRYFNPSFNYVDKDGHALPENTPEDIRTYVLQDYQRMESLSSGSWDFIGIRAQAEIVIDGVIQRISPGALWGIESDSDTSYLKEVEQEELSSLRGILHELGFSKRAITSAVKEAQL